MSGIFNLRSTMGALAFVAVLTCSLMVALSQNEDVESCVPVAQELSPCLGFIKGSDSAFGGEHPSPSCCSGVKKLVGDAKTKKDKVDLCECIKKSLSMIGPYDPSRIPLIPKECGIPVQIPPIDNSTDCSKVEGLQFGSAFLYKLGDIHHH
ncbi:non-specific lipid-transfer protein Cw18-like [Benincasa hispida]|uniref:non-specific lipid-transfer protein Cw18-like n=1 Tax=Benincasa hispida TaxID=102211 RepID=UPI0019015B9E|nr:non-specific lipid-transfer protein Cw18-like [Benincasa hispida]